LSRRYDREVSLKVRALTTSGRAREYAKIALRTSLHKHNLDLVRDPFPNRVARALRWLGVSTVLDIGANIGQYGAALRAGGYAGRIISCEPLPDAYAHLSRRAASDDNWAVVHTAVGAETGSSTINVSANSYSSSLLPMTDAHRTAAPGSDFIGTVEVPLTTVAQLLTAHRVAPERTLLKIDTQGYEAPVLSGAGAALSSFAAVQLELSFVPLYAGQELFGQLTGRLVAAGFGVYCMDPGFADPRTGRMLQCDGLFIREDLMPDPAASV
jgi:FkbM family methyltransferase